MEGLKNLAQHKRPEHLCITELERFDSRYRDAQASGPIDSATPRFSSHTRRLVLQTAMFDVFVYYLSHCFLFLNGMTRDGFPSLVFRLPPPVATADLRHIG